MNEAVLMKIGLTRIEAKLYLILLELGSTSAGPLIKKSGLHRATVYDVLERLIEKGIVSFIIKDGKKHYESEEPEKLSMILESRKEDVENQIEIFDKALPELKQIRKMAESKEEAHILKGSKGLFTQVRDMTKEKKTIYVFGAKGLFTEKFKPVISYYIRERRRKKIHMKIIYSERMRGVRTKEELPYTQQRFIPKEYDSPATVWIYGEKVAIVLWSDKPLVIQIHNREIRDAYMQFFNLMWSVAKP